MCSTIEIVERDFTKLIIATEKSGIFLDLDKLYINIKISSNIDITPFLPFQGNSDNVSTILISL